MVHSARSRRRIIQYTIHSMGKLDAEIQRAQSDVTLLNTWVMWGLRLRFPFSFLRVRKELFLCRGDLHACNCLLCCPTVTWNDVFDSSSTDTLRRYVSPVQFDANTIYMIEEGRYMYLSSMCTFSSQSISFTLQQVAYNKLIIVYIDVHFIFVCVCWHRKSSTSVYCYPSIYNM